MPFALGHLVMTRGVADLAARDSNFAAVLTDLLRRHIMGDWGDLCPEDKAANDQALETGGRLFSAYHLKSGVKVWLITEADRSVTTFLFPEEY